ncbi:MAG TPA: YceI family protein [Vicinamibacterales bacterium]|jgi:polyisoprenoid-binding protein YceI
MTRHRPALTALAVGVIVAAAIVRGAAARPYTIDAGRSSATIEVGKSGAFSFAAGHSHEAVASKLAGTIAVDVDDPAHSSVRVTIDASALKVTGKGESAADVPKVQETMAGPKVLDVQQYPTIAFASTNVALKAHTGTTLDVAVTGQLTIRGMAREITVPVNVRMDGGTLTATGRFPVKQTDYGMKPVSVGGVVSVKDVVNISFTIVGK